MHFRRSISIINILFLILKFTTGFNSERGFDTDSKECSDPKYIIHNPLTLKSSFPPHVPGKWLFYTPNHDDLAREIQFWCFKTLV